MSWQLSAYTVLAGVAAATFAVLALVGARRSKASASAFSALMASGMVWSLCYGIQLGVTTRAEQLPWQQAALAVSATLPPLLLVFALRYAGRGSLVTRSLLAVLAAEVVGFAVLVATNDVHRLVWTDATLHPSVWGPVLDLTFGVGYYLHIVFAYTVVTTALAIFFTVFFRGESIYRGQAGILILGAIPPFLSHVGYTLNLLPHPAIDPTPFMFTVTGLLYALALFHFDLLERTPVAQQRALELVGDGLLVVDVDGNVVDANRVAQQVYDLDGEAPPFSRLTGASSLEEVHGTTKTAVVDGIHRVYDHLVSELHDDQGRSTGHVVVLRDVTDRNASEQRLEVANRVLRHNLRNDMNVILGYAEVLEDLTESAEGQRMAETIYETAEGMVSLSEKLRQAVDLQRDENRSTTVDVTPVVERLVDEFRAENPGVTFELDVPEHAQVVGVSGRALALSVRNLLENAVEHNDPGELAVTVTVWRADGRVRIRVSDTGTGLPSMEREVLETGSETPLQHGSGVGLWLVYWVVNAAGGSVTVDTDTPGTTITLDLPRGSPDEPRSGVGVSSATA